MRYCTKCGAAIQDGVNFCTVCGNPASENAPAQPQPNQYGYYQPATPPNTDRSTASMVCGILSLVFILVPFLHLALAIVALVLASKDKKANSGVNSSYGKAGFITGLISLILGGLLIVLTVYLIGTFFIIPLFLSIFSEGIGGNYGYYGDMLSTIVGMFL